MSDADLSAWSVEWSQPSDRPDYPYRINKSAIVIADTASRAIEMVLARSHVGGTVHSVRRVSKAGSKVLLP